MLFEVSPRCMRIITAMENSLLNTPEMATNKRRKLEGESSPAPQVVSAFAARQKLWGLSSPLKTNPKDRVPDLDEDARHLKEVSDEKLDKVQPKSPRKGKRKVRQKQGDATLPPDDMSDQIVVALDLDDSAPPSPVLSPIPTSPRPEPKERTTTLYSSFRPTKKNYQQKADGRTRLTSGEGERLVILGSYGIHVVEGQITIGGAILPASEKTHWVHAPHCHALPVLRVVEDSIVELHPHPAAHGLRELSKLNPSFGKLWNEEVLQGATSTQTDKAGPTFKIMFTPEDRPKRAFLQDLVSPGEWNKKLAGLVAANKKSTPIIFLCGPKSSGKSTFGRLLTNRLVTDHGGFKKKPWSTAIVLDLDPGQPEYGPPGVISVNKVSAPILSPPFCHPSGVGSEHSQLRAHAIAAVSPALDPTHFIECALDLFSHYKQSIYNKSPLIINTPGWIQGTGLDILAELVRRITPTEVIYMSREGPEETVDSLKAVCSSNIPFHALPSQSSENTPRTPINLRTLQTMSYFHLDWKSVVTSQHHTWNPIRLTEMRPWRVRYKGPGRGFVGILCYDHQPASDLLMEAINGMILALVKVEDKAAFRDLLDSSSPDGITWTAEGIPLIQNGLGRTLDPRHSQTLGLVLIRGIDTKRGELQLLTPLPAAEVIAAEEAAGKENSSLVLVAGKFDTPTWAYAEDLYWRASSGVGAGGQDAASESDEDEEGDYVEEKGPLSQGLKPGDELESLPWVETLHGSQKRSVGSRVWRVRRDLGRN